MQLKDNTTMDIFYHVHGLGKAIMEVNWWMCVFGILHSMLSLCDGKSARTVHVPHNAPVGYEVTKLLQIEAPHVIESFQGHLQNTFNVLENGAVVTKETLTGLGGASQVLVVRNGVNDKILESLHINILQSTPNHLVFQQSKYIGTIKENEKVGSHVKIIGQIKVLGCENVTYSLLYGSKSFSYQTMYLESTHDNVLTSLKSFNRELQGLYIAVLEGKCSSGESAVTYIDIHILDKNDIIPKFMSSDVFVRTSPDQCCSKITTIKAYDGDQNEHITYSLEDGPEFYIDSVSGDVYSEADYLYTGSYSVTVFATDSAGHISEPLSLHIDVLGFKPQHNSSHHLTKRATLIISRQFDIVENSTISKSLFSVTSVKPRPMAERYSQISASVDVFEEPDFNGQVYLKRGRSLDFEDINQRQIVLIYNRTNLNRPEGKTN